MITMITSPVWQLGMMRPCMRDCRGGSQHERFCGTPGRQCGALAALDLRSSLFFLSFADPVLLKDVGSLLDEVALSKARRSYDSR